MSENSPKLLDLINGNHKNSEKIYGLSSSSSSCNEENKLELRLGLPGDNGNWSAKQGLKSREREESLLSLGYFNGGVIRCGKEQNHKLWTTSSSTTTTTPTPTTTTTSNSAFLQNHHQEKQQYQTCPKQANGLTVMVKDSSQPCCTRIAELQSAEKKAFSPSSALTAVPNTSQKRAAPTPVVGWPPIRSFRKNLASSSSGKSVPEPQSAIPSKPVNEKPVKDNSHKGLFVKINMDGVPIGRKVDLSVHNNYDSLSSSVAELFRGLLAAQRDSSAGAIDNKQEQEPITGLLDGSGEYTLVYEDNEGDRMLVGDVPWHMFVSTVKRLRVLKSSDLSTLSRGVNKEGKLPIESPSK